MTEPSIPTERITLSEQDAAKAITRHGFAVALCNNDGKPHHIVACEESDVADVARQTALANPGLKVVIYKPQKVIEACREAKSI